VLSDIESKKTIDDDLDKKLRAAIEAFKQTVSV
jgi:hypothetical protein